MRNTILIAVIMVLTGPAAQAGPGSFAAQPTQAAQPPATAKQPTARVGWFGRLFSAVSSQPQKAAPALPANAPAASGTANPVLDQAVAAQANAARLGSALSPATQPSSPAESLVANAKAAEAQGNHTAARQQLQQAVGAAPDDAATLRAAGHFEDRRGRLKVAEALYRRAAESDPVATAALNDLAICLARQDRMDESAATFRKAISKDPTKALYRNNLAKVLVEQDEINAALDQLAAVHSLAVSHYNLGSLLSRKGDLAAARQHYQIASTADPSLDEARHALAALLAQPKSRAPKVANLPWPEDLPAAPTEANTAATGGASQPAAAVTKARLTGAPIVPPTPATPQFRPVAPGYTPAVASPYYLPPQSVQQR